MIHPSLLRTPIAVDEAAAIVEGGYDQANVEVLAPGPHHLRILRQLLRFSIGPSVCRRLGQLGAARRAWDAAGVTGTAHDVRYPYAEFVALEASSNTKHEYLAGQIFAMAGGSPEHAAVTAAVARHLGNQLLAGPCRVYSSNLRVRVTSTDLATYPDVTVVCGELRTADDDPHAVTNPTALVEVLSPSTRDYDLVEKYAHYRQMDSLRVYVLVDAAAQTIELRSRSDGGFWSSRVFGRDEHVPIEAVGANLDVRAVFDESLG